MNPADTIAELNATISLMVPILERVTWGDARADGQEITQKVCEMFEALYQVVKNRDTETQH